MCLSISTIAVSVVIFLSITVLVTNGTILKSPWHMILYSFLYMAILPFFGLFPIPANCTSFSILIVIPPSQLADDGPRKV